MNGTVLSTKKPSNIFLDSEGNVRLGDFGLATTDRMNSRKKSNASKLNHQEDEDEITKSLTSNPIDEITDISDLLGGSALMSGSRLSGYMSASESITGGVGTTYYRAPEQELANQSKRIDGGYDIMADIYSLGIVLFEMFHPPFQTGMERFNILTTLRSDNVKANRENKNNSPSKDEGTRAKVSGYNDSTPPSSFHDENEETWKTKAEKRFPDYFIQSTPEKAQQMILWCLEHLPSKRPSAQDLLSVRLDQKLFFSPSMIYFCLKKYLFVYYYCYTFLSRICSHAKWKLRDSTLKRHWK